MYLLATFAAAAISYSKAGALGRQDVPIMCRRQSEYIHVLLMHRSLLYI